MNTQLKSVKEHLKSYATYLKMYKTAFKEDQRNIAYDQWGYGVYPANARNIIDSQYNSNSEFKSSYDYRHRHVAYCLLKGKTLREIESNIESREYVTKLGNANKRFYYEYRNWLNLDLVKIYYELFNKSGSAPFPADISYDSKLTKSDWVIKEAVNG